MKFKSVTLVPSVEEIKSLREAAGLSTAEAAEIFGLSNYKAWWRKETGDDSGRKLKVGEYNLLLLLADAHSHYQLVEREQTK
jgi:transcriptional regulator with XRE-family HTH domain